MTGRFYALNFALLPAPDVIEPLDFEVAYTQHRDRFLQAWTQARDVDPTLPEPEPFLIESHPVAMLLEAVAYREVLLRARINAAALATMVAYADGADLDNVAASFGVSRLDGESDTRLRTRVTLAPEALASAGTAGGYIYHAMTAAPSVPKVTAVSTAPGRADITVQGAGADKLPTEEQLVAVRDRLSAEDVKPLTDQVVVSPPTVIDADIVATVTFAEGPNAIQLAAQIEGSIQAYVDRVTMLGGTLARSGIIAAAHLDQVVSVDLTSPAADAVAAYNQCVRVTDVSVTTVIQA